MKVTVCFGDVRVVVPCGDGGILVRDLIREATLRYKKAVGKSPDAWVPVHSLQSAGGGILDPDDRLSDVADDRERIVASFGAADPPHHHGDGASGSSVGTGSPDIFHDGDKYAPYPAHRADIEVTGEQIASGVPTLQVRRGSEPSLSQIGPAPDGGPPAPPDRAKRWSAAPLVADPAPGAAGRASPADWPEGGADGGFKRGARDGGARLSMQFLGDGAGYRWAEAAERAATSRQHGSTSLPRESRRKEPLGQANSSASPIPPSPNDTGELIVIRNQPGPLGIHVVPDYDGSGKDRGLLVQGIEPGGRIDRDGRLAIFDRIVEINGQNLVNLPFQRVQEMFKLSLTSPELRLRVIKNAGLDSLRKPPAPVYPHPHQHQDEKENAMVECEQKPYIPESTNTKVATVSPTKKVPAISKNLKGLLTTNTRKIGRKIEIELVKGPRGLGFSITTRDNPAGGNCPIYIKNIIPEGAAVEDGRLRIGDRLLQVNDEEMTGKTQAEAVAVLRKAPPGSKVKIVVSRQEDVPDNGLPRVIGVDQVEEKETENHSDDVPPNIPPLPQSHLQALQNARTTDRGGSVAKIISQFQGQVSIMHPPDKIDSSMVFPWKHREILTFNIPVHDSEKAGLGISVKGKTSESGDLGIFIKSVIHGGAASRDKRLKPNDQLLNVNGISLLQQSNSDAMETLRKAMLHTEGPVPGNITLTIARRAASPNSSRNGQNRSTESLLNSSNHTEIFGSNNSQETSQEASVENSNSNASGGSTNTVIYNPNGLPTNQLSPMHTWNPVLERLTGNSKPHQQQLRNESYYKATHDTWSTSMLGNSSFGNLTTTTVNMPTGEPILIEDEYGSRVLQHQNPQINVHMTNKPNFSNGIIPENRNDHEPDGKASLSNNNYDKSNEISSSQSTIQNTDTTYASQLSLENPQGFSRDAFGRQSMSEKRHATLDAKSTDTYQRTKKMREERTKGKEPNLVRVGSVESVISINRSSVDHPEYADKLGQLGPSLGMKKSSSLESLQTMVQEIQMKEERDPAYSYRGPNGALKVIRGIGCEESFRAAVVDPNHQSEMGAKKHWLLDGPVEEREIDGFNNVRGGPRQSSLNAALDKNKSGKKKPGLFKGIGSMFRFGKHRKVELVEPTQHYHPANEFDSNANVQPQENNNHADNQNQQNQNERLQQQEQQQQQTNQHQQNITHQHQQQQTMHQHQQQQLQQMQREQQIQREPIYQRHGFIHRHAEQVQVIPENTVAPPLKYRQNQEQRREMHRQKMMQRHTYYQSDERENIYEQHRQHQRADQRDAYGEYGRPGSRSGITEPVPFTHYVNYNELQSHLSRKQHQYHSQRQTRPDSQLRPISNYYEYESVQSVLNRGRQNVPVHVTAQQAPPSYQDLNSNSLPRNQQQPPPPPQARHPAGRTAQHRGPFVTQVTIGDHQKNGTKV